MTTSLVSAMVRATAPRMVSSTQQHERIRKRKMTTSGTRNKRDRRRIGTPAFPVHVEGYNPKAPDAKKPTDG